ncbi:hypothetical protein BDV30DRAFT_232984 [Aspergillus minisclerotigenes]|uniref:N-acetyltransferase domain-containing protein n=1 Tax=Aspergillus minisclerotigenes TaxID=656917 RepID=A0A5N6JJL8_9EURO|nr:hypothetical protein BDV30DRAFT_232984 [Aspergillus minisclerotigenes]
MSATAEVTLIPWDPLSESHRTLLFKQRVECSWDMEMVQEIWRDQQIRGEKCIYWIPTQADFIPIGHISLDSKNKKAEKLDLDISSDNVFWIKSFFILHNLQGKGIGGATMNEIERIATQEPLCAKTLMLDTVERGDQLREEFAKATYGGVPKFTNQDWYSRRGYRSLRIVQNYYDSKDRNGKVWDTKTIFMRKDLL